MVELDCGIRRMTLRPPDEAGARPRVFPLFGGDLTAAARRFAVAETLSHLERLVVEGRAAPREDDRLVTYTPAETGGRRDTS